MTWARKRAVDVHDETAGYFSAEYASDNVYDSPFRYGRALIDAQWRKAVEGLPADAVCLDIGSGIGAYMVRLIEAGFNVRGIEPSAEMRKLSRERVPAEFGTYVNKLDGYHQFVALEKLRNALLKAPPRYHVEFETVSSLQRKLANAGFQEIEIRGTMFAPLRPIFKLSPRLATLFSKWTLPRESWLSDGTASHLFAGHIIATARRAV